MSGIVVTGATGIVGHELIRQLVASGETVTGVARGPRAWGVPHGAEFVALDLADPAGLAPHLHSARALFLNPAAVERGAERLLALAAEADVEQVVLLSALTVAHPAGEARFADRFRRLEKLVRSGPVPWTIVQAGDFAGNARVWAPQIVVGDVVRAPHPGAATSPLAEVDLAAVLARVLTEAGHAGQTYVLTGPDSVDQRDKVAAIGAALGRELELVALTADQARAGMVANGVPVEIIDRLLGSLADYAVTPGPTTTTVSDILGRPAQSFADWAVANSVLFGG